MSGALKRDEWETVRLGDVCDVVSGSTPKTANLEYWDGDILWITPAELNEDSHYIYDTTRKITEAGRDSASLTLLPKGTVLLSSRAPIGKVGIVGTEMCCNQGFKNLVCSPVIFNNYLFWFLKGKTAYLNSLGRGATFKEISKGIVESIQIPLPPLDVQRRIADTLDKVTELITLRKTQLEKLDELVKARFVEMFGDPEHNEKGWDIKKLEKLCVVGSSKRIYQSEQSVSGVSFLRISNLVNLIDTGIKDSDLYIPRELFLKLKEQGLVPTAGDILITARGTLGKCYIVKVDDEFYFQDGMISWLSKLDKVINAVYLTYLFSQYGFRKQIDSLQAGSTVAYLSIAQTKKLDIMLPPLDLQTQFASFVSSVEEAKAPIQQSLDALETLKKSLMQEYFG